MGQGVTRLRPLLPAVAVLLLLVAALPPLGSYARHNTIGQALQFLVFATAAPALLVIGWPDWLTPARGRGPAAPAGPLVLRVVASLVPYLALVIIWRVPAVLAALRHDGALTVLELLTLAASGCALWAELTGLFARREPLPRPLRALMAAVAMWTIWVIAYVTGMSANGATAGAADRQVAVAIMWAVPAVCYIPVVYVTMMTWLGSRDDPTEEARQMFARSELDGSPRPPRGWRG